MFLESPRDYRKSKFANLTAEMAHFSQYHPYLHCSDRFLKSLDKFLSLDAINNLVLTEECKSRLLLDLLPPNLKGTKSCGEPSKDCVYTKFLVTLTRLVECFIDGEDVSHEVDVPYGPCLDDFEFVANNFCNNLSESIHVSLNHISLVSHYFYRPLC